MIKKLFGTKKKRKVSSGNRVFIGRVCPYCPSYFSDLDEYVRHIGKKHGEPA